MLLDRISTADVMRNVEELQYLRAFKSAVSILVEPLDSLKNSARS
jgi:hypothetical protein